MQLLDRLRLSHKFLILGGIALVPLATAAHYPGLVTIPVQAAPRRRVYFAWGRHPTPAALAFLGLVQQALE